jgi:hypothetical protein
MRCSARVTPVISDESHEPSGNPFSSTGLLAIVAITFGRNPKLSSNAMRAGLDFSGADLTV